MAALEPSASVSGNLTPFPSDYRAAGILLHVTSLPSEYGIGDVGPAARLWIDRLADAGQRWWQALPMGPTSYDNSPYQPLSSFAGNTLLISPDWLVEDELLAPADCAHNHFSQEVVDYDAVIAFKREILLKAWDRFNRGARADLRQAYEQFCFDQKHWLDDYGLFQALKSKFGNAHYLEWPDELAHRNPAALERARREFAGQLNAVRFTQFLVFRQAERLKAYANSKGLRLIGDMPFFISPDSSDAWSNPDLLLLDEAGRPRFIAGVPPDYFSAEGQLWGNPVYDWDYLHKTGYRWWIDRLRSLLDYVDVVRLDHFRAFAAAWYVPTDATTARGGRWVPGPGADFFREIGGALGGLPFIAEDLGLITPDVDALRDQFGLPGMRVLQFAFDGKPENPYLPENYVTNAVAYTGTHDNPTTRGWFDDLSGQERDGIREYLRKRSVESGDISRALIELAWSSVAGFSMAPLQDVLDLGRDARMNVPGRPDGNWRWRCTESMLDAPAFAWLRELTKKTNRSDGAIGPDVKTRQATSAG